jgi:hypothetical protein
MRDLSQALENLYDMEGPLRTSKAREERGGDAPPGRLPIEEIEE